MTLQLGAGLGAVYLGSNRCRFRVWAPNPGTVETVIVLPRERVIPMRKAERDYWETVADDIPPGSLYYYRLDGTALRADPASRFQPRGVHGPSQVFASGGVPRDDGGWTGLPLEDYILYELHVGTFTPEGTFDAVIAHLDEFLDLGVTAIELMPVAQFPGSRNWGYDGVFLFAPQNSYGGPDALKRLVDACHKKGLAVVLDVVYNHLGPEGNYVSEFGPYFTDRYKTSWGAAVNFDGPGSDDVRRFFIENALYWLSEFSVDALRLDAIHGILDFSARPFLAELAEAVGGYASRTGRKVHLIPESDLNDVRPIMPPELGGYGMDAQWSDDFHHALHTLLTGERDGYYVDFGRIEHLAKAYREGFVYSGQYSAYRRRRHGNSSLRLPAKRFVVFAQNHDQVGNRMLGDRLSRIVSFEALKLAAGAVLLSPCIPLLFMGEEYGEEAPFLYFISHTDEELVEAVRKGRLEEFAAFRWVGEIPDPQDEATYRSSRIDLGLGGKGRHRTLREFHRELIGLRKTDPVLSRLDRDDMEVIPFERERILFVRRWNEGREAAAAFHFGDSPAAVPLPLPPGLWRRRLDSSDSRWDGGGSAVPEEIDPEGSAVVVLSPKSFVLFTKG